MQYNLISSVHVYIYILYHGYIIYTIPWLYYIYYTMVILYILYHGYIIYTFVFSEFTAETTEMHVKLFKVYYADFKFLDNNIIPPFVLIVLLLFVINFVFCSYVLIIHYELA